MKLPSNRITRGLSIMGIGLLISILSLGFIIWQFSDAFSGKGYFSHHTADFNTELTIFFLPFIGVGTMLAGIGMSVFGVINKLRRTR